MFYEKYVRVTKEKKSVINLNLDPAFPKQRNKNVIPEKYLSNDNGEALLHFSFDIIEQVSDYCCSVKPNTQYFLSDSKILRKLVKKIHDEGMIAVLDHKLSDIGSTNDSAIFWISDMGFDAFTFSPFAGTISKTVEHAHTKELGVLVLTLMSNPEAEDVMVNTLVGGEPYYLHIAQAVRTFQADGCVVGVTGFVKEEYIKNIDRIVGDQAVCLLQGVGPQGGDLDKVRYVHNPLVSLGRAVLYSPNPEVEIKKYYRKLRRLKF